MTSLHGPRGYRSKGNCFRYVGSGSQLGLAESGADTPLRLQGWLLVCKPHPPSFKADYGKNLVKFRPRELHLGVSQCRNRKQKVLVITPHGPSPAVLHSRAITFSPWSRFPSQNPRAIKTRLCTNKVAWTSEAASMRHHPTTGSNGSVDPE